MTARFCLDCLAPISARNRTGRCQPCSVKCPEVREKQRAGVAKAMGRKQRPIPPDFERLIEGLTLTQARIRFTAGCGTIYRWCEAVGKWAKDGRRAVTQDAAPRGTGGIFANRTASGGRAFKAKRSGYAGPKSAFTGRLPADDSAEGRAADFLRRETRAAIYRCNERGAVPERGEKRFWRYGNVVLAGAEMIERAERRGFCADGWREIAA